MRVFYLKKKKKAEVFSVLSEWLKMLLVSFARTIKSAFHLPKAMLCFAFLAKKLSVAPHYPQNSSFRHWTPSMMLTQSPFPVFGCIPSKLDYSIFRERALDFSPDIFVRVIEQITFPCSVHSTHLCWVATSLLKSISYAIDCETFPVQEVQEPGSWSQEACLLVEDGDTDPKQENKI